MMKAGDVNNGFPDAVPLEKLEGNVFVDPAMLEENLMFGSPETAIAKLKKYQALGVDSFIYYASMGLGFEEQKRSLDLFCNEPHNSPLKVLTMLLCKTFLALFEVKTTD